MTNWQKVIAQTFSNVEERFDMLKFRLRERLGGRDPITIYTYRGYGTPEKLYLKGRVLEDKGIVAPEDNDSIWENLANMYKRFESDEIPYARLKVRFQDIEKDLVTDQEGFFNVWLEPNGPLPADKLWQDVELELTHPLRPGYPPVRATGNIFVPPATARFGVISDIDDTVVQTDAANILRMARTVFLGNARTRLPFKGVAAFYRALFEGSGGKEMNPLFYVSSSPWNLYDLLTDFFNLLEIPIGPILFLRDWGLTENEILPTQHKVHKTNTIDLIMSLYASMPFILIGDSGQEDPEIYYDIVRRYPKRILAVYIRNVSRDLRRPESIRKLAEKVVAAGSTLILADDTLPMAEHAAQNGWISASSLPAIEARKEADEAPPGPVEKLLGEEEKPAEAPTVVVQEESKQATQQAVETGAIEEALEKTETESPKPPSVVVKGEDSEEEKKDQAKGEV